jgi:(p)ppGpp synthase/HD superfamily hydrolase
LFGPYHAPLEVQIRTEDMHSVAESGIAAHWGYKTGKTGSSAAQERARQWIKELLEMQTEAGDSMEFIEHVKVDLFPKDVYVFTPAGDIMELPRGATAVDLAYAVHTDVGNTCIAVKIDGRYAPLRSQLLTGQNVEVVTASWGRPNANWLTFVVTGKARAAIRNYLKNLRTEEAVELGRRLLNQALAPQSLTLDDIENERIGALLEELKLETLDDLLEDIGLGQRPAALVTRRLNPAAGEIKPGADAPRNNHPVFIRGSEGMVVSLGKCCHPIPGDPVLGFVSAGRGVVIHTAACRNIAEYADQPEKWVDVEWEPTIDGDFPVEVRIDTANQKGVLATVAAAISDMGANIENVSMENSEGSTATLSFVIGVTDRVHLAQLIRRIRGISEVTRIMRKGS